jgi:hypothetical protein
MEPCKPGIAKIGVFDVCHHFQWLYPGQQAMSFIPGLPGMPLSITLFILSSCR